jgi:hypothetical protein
VGIHVLVEAVLIMERNNMDKEIAVVEQEFIHVLVPGVKLTVTSSIVSTSTAAAVERNAHVLFAF